MAAGGPPALWAAAAALEPARGGGGGDWRNLVLVRSPERHVQRTLWPA